MFTDPESIYAIEKCSRRERRDTFKISTQKPFFWDRLAFRLVTFPKRVCCLEKLNQNVKAARGSTVHLVPEPEI